MAGLCLALLWACEQKQPVKIGFVGGLTGRVADLGIAGRNGAMLAMEQCNDAGGIHGRRVQLVVRDDEQNPDVARRVVSELLKMDLKVIIGPMTSSMAMATVPIVNTAQCLMVSPTVTTTELSGKDDNFFRVVSTTTEYASKSARYQYEKLGNHTAVAIYDLGNRAYTEIWLNDFRRTFEDLGGVMLATHTFESSDETVFYEAVVGLLARQPSLVVVVANAVDAAMICQQIRKIDQRVTIAMSEWGSTERYVELAGIAGEGVYVAQFLNRMDQSAGYLRFRQAYLDRFGQEPGFAGLAGYDAANLVLSTLGIQSPDQSLKETVLNRGTFAGAQNDFTLDRFGDAERETFITVVHNGTYQALE